MVTAELLAARRDAMASSVDLAGLRDRLARRATRVLEQLPEIPAAKALLSQDGGVCPTDGATLVFDPWSPADHRCPRCGAAVQGERHQRWWARYQHLWNAERAAHLAALAAIGGHPAAAARATAILAAYGERYFSYPNRDNVLGPARLLFSTYLESMWVSSYLAAAALLRAAELLDEDTERQVTQVADEAANLIGEFDEGYANRQTWNNAALAAIAAWFSDAELMRHAVQGRTGMVVHLAEGFRPDGMWYEGENYHLFALRGLLTGLAWARVAGVAVTAAGALADRLAAALMAPARTALPDLTFPARKDSRFGVSLAQPEYLETWEVGLAMLGRGGRGGATDGELARWLQTLYAAPAPTAQLIDCYLHEADAGAPGSTTRSRQDLSWWALLEMLPALPDATAAGPPGSVLLADQGLAVLRTGARYASLECGPYAGGHAHADRLHLTLHDGAVHWLRDPGTGSYVSRDLLWYRGTLAHNAPRLDGRSQPQGSADCLAFDARDGWSWAVGRFDAVTRTVVAGPLYLMDLVDLGGADERMLEVPWHFAGRWEVVSPGAWEAGELSDEFVTNVREFVPAHAGDPVRVRLDADGRELGVWFLGAGRLLSAEVPGAPGMPRATMLVIRARARNARVLTVMTPGDPAAVRAVEWLGDAIAVETSGGTDQHRAAAGGWTVLGSDGACTLAGAREARVPFTPFLVLEPHEPVRGTALALHEEPAVDGTLAGFDLAEPFTLDLEDQYRRSEEPFAGAEEFSARAWANWTDDALFLAVEVAKPELWFRPADYPLRRLDNESEDVHSDGLQVFLREREGRGFGAVLVVPEPGGAVRIRAAGTAEGEPLRVAGAWRETGEGYQVTLRCAWPEWLRPHPGGWLGFDLHVNEMYADRERRAGQLVWSGGNGWVYLRGDRQDPERLGRLDLLG